MLGFCENCQEYIDVHIKEEAITTDIDGAEFEYLAKIAICEYCGEEVFISDIQNYNLKALSTAPGRFK